MNLSFELGVVATHISVNTYWPNINKGRMSCTSLHFQLEECEAFP